MSVSLKKTPQIAPTWKTGIYIGDGNVAVKPVSYKPMMIFANGETVGNALRFATQEEALASAHELLIRWTMPTNCTVHASSDPVNYMFANGQNISL